MALFENPLQVILGIILVLTSLGVILAKKPVHAGLSFLLTLLTLSVMYLQLSAEFIAVMQVLVYAGAILVIFMFVIVLFQDAHQQIEKYPARSSTMFLVVSGTLFLLALTYLGTQLMGLSPSTVTLADGYGKVHALGKVLYLDFFFPFEAVILIFLVAVVGALYIGRKEQVEQHTSPEASITKGE